MTGTQKLRDTDLCLNMFGCTTAMRIRRRPKDFEEQAEYDRYVTFQAENRGKVEGKLYELSTEYIKRYEEARQ